MSYSRRWLRRMQSSWMLFCVALLKTDVADEIFASNIKVNRIGEVATTLALTRTRSTLWRNVPYRSHAVYHSRIRYFLLLILWNLPIAGLGLSCLRVSFWNNDSSSHPIFSAKIIRSSQEAYVHRKFRWYVYVEIWLQEQRLRSTDRRKQTYRVEKWHC
jgi:hypothetical protein